MSIRLRKNDSGIWVAHCAAEFRANPNNKGMETDVYLDDVQHHALTEKFEVDFRSMGFLKDEKAEAQVHKLTRALFTIIELHIDETKVGLIPACNCKPCKIAREALWETKPAKQSQCKKE